MLPAASFATAVNCCFAATASVTGFGTIVIVAITPGVTVIDACPEIVPTVATTVFANTPVVVPAVNMPVGLIVPPPAAIDQTGVIATTRPSASRPTATICCVLAAGSVELGVTTIDCTVPGLDTP